MKVYEDSWGDCWLRLGNDSMLLIKVGEKDVIEDLFVADTIFVIKQYGPLKEINV